MSRLINKCFICIVCLIILCTLENLSHALSSNAIHGHDAYPLFSTADPHEFLYREERTRLKDLLENLEDEENNISKHISLAITAFGQNSDRGRNFKNESIYLGDIGGRWSMIGLLYGDPPNGQNLPPALQEAKGNLFPILAGAPLTDPRYFDQEQQFGFFSIPVVYRKRGVRLEILLKLIKDFGIQMQFGIADICQIVDDTCKDVPDVCTATNALYTYGFKNLTNSETAPEELTGESGTITKEQVNENLMKKIQPIAQEIGLNICSWNKCSIEDARFNFFWRHAFEVNTSDKSKWSSFFLIPFFVVGFTAPAGERKDPTIAFALPFGNNEHNTIGLKGGLNIDFTETVEIGFELGFSHFFGKEFCNFFVPTNRFQSGIYPFKTKVKVCPGNNYHLGLKMSAHHFLGNLSFYFQYLFVSHKEDEITLCKFNDEFKPDFLKKYSYWKTQFANMGFNYDISPNISLGILWQAPISQRNAYRSSTVMASFIASY